MKYLPPWADGDEVVCFLSDSALCSRERVAVVCSSLFERRCFGANHGVSAIKEHQRATCISNQESHRHTKYHRTKLPQPPKARKHIPAKSQTDDVIPVFQGRVCCRCLGCNMWGRCRMQGPPEKRHESIGAQSNLGRHTGSETHLAFRWSDEKLCIC